MRWLTVSKSLPQKIATTGKLQSTFSRLIKVLRKKSSATHNTFQRMIGDYLARKAADNHASPLVSCLRPMQRQPIRESGKSVVSPDFDFCDKCEAEKSHPTPMTQDQEGEHAPASQVLLRNQSQNRRAPRTTPSMRESVSESPAAEGRWREEGESTGPDS